MAYDGKAKFIIIDYLCIHSSLSDESIAKYDLACNSDQGDRFHFSRARSC
jgi:hypothetical protein